MCRISITQPRRDQQNFAFKPQRFGNPHEVQSISLTEIEVQEHQVNRFSLQNFPCFLDRAAACDHF